MHAATGLGHTGSVIRVLLIDDHPVVREGLAAILGNEPQITVVGQFAGAKDALLAMRHLAPDVVILDVRLPGMSGIEACETLFREHPRVRTIMLTSLPSEGAMLASFSAGARGFLVKESADPGLICEAVKAVHAGGTFVDPRIAGRLVSLATKRGSTKGPFGLTLQEMRVLSLLPQGLSNRDISAQLALSEHTVKTHLQHAMRKLGVRDRDQAALVALREGLA